jgi:hypothetical protein
MDEVMTPWNILELLVRAEHVAARRPAGAHVQLQQAEDRNMVVMRA